jgi:hypothetical protein
LLPVTLLPLVSLLLLLLLCPCSVLCCCCSMQLPVLLVAVVGAVLPC